MVLGTRTDEVVERLVSEGHADLVRQLAARLEAVDGKGVGDASGVLELLHGLVLLGRMQNDGVSILAELCNVDDSSRISRRDGHDADVVLRPLLNGAELLEHTEDVLCGLVCALARNVRLVEHNKDILEVALATERPQTSLQALKAAVVVDILANLLRQAFTSLLDPGIVIHACRHKDAVGMTVKAMAVVHIEHQTDESGDDTRLACLHLGSEVNPQLL